MRNGIVRRPISHGVSGRPHRAWWGKLLSWRVLVAVLIIAALWEIPALLQKWLWMRQLNYSEHFLDAARRQVGHDLRGFHRRVSLPLDQSPSGGPKQFRTGRS